jgi:hypothetical protein
MMIEKDRDLSDPKTRSSAGAQCLVQFRDESEARSEVDEWTWDTPIGRTIDRQSYRVTEQIFRRTHE